MNRSSVDAWADLRRFVEAESTRAGVRAAQSLEGHEGPLMLGGPHVNPSDDWALLICEAQMFDLDLDVSAAVAFMTALREESARLHRTPPTWPDVAAALQSAIDPENYPDVDRAELVEHLTRHIPAAS
ncbi:hypothetical protein [Clavibacter michiganensis]|uniref:hypothetical protein n=1 Tax=Clavibacter michiganensis TaxID=28447 RepID=UPI00345BA2C0